MSHQASPPPPSPSTTLVTLLVLVRLRLREGSEIRVVVILELTPAEIWISHMVMVMAIASSWCWVCIWPGSCRICWVISVTPPRLCETASPLVYISIYIYIYRVIRALRVIIRAMRVIRAISQWAFRGPERRQLHLSLGNPNIAPNNLNNPNNLMFVRVPILAIAYSCKYIKKSSFYKILLKLQNLNGSGK